MFECIVNEELSLRLLEPVDAQPLFALMDRQRAYLRQWLPWVDKTQSERDTRQFINLGLSQLAANNGFQAGIWHRRQLVGAIGLHAIDWQNRSTTIGYWLSSEAQGQGLMTQSVRAAGQICFDRYGLNRIDLRAAVENRRSRAIAERLGFVYEGCLRQAEWLYDHFVDHALYAILAEQWSDPTKP